MPAIFLIDAFLSGCSIDTFVDYVLEKLPFKVDLIQTDNGSEFQAGFHVHVLDRGIRHVYIRPSTPRLNGKVERSHRIDDEEFYRMLAEPGGQRRVGDRQRSPIPTAGFIPKRADA